MLLLGLCLSAPANAAKLGKVSVLSRVGEPATAEIEVVPSEEDAGSFGVRLLPPEDGATDAPTAAAGRLDLRATLAQRGARKVIRITSLQPLVRSDLKVMVELRWAGGIRLGEYLLRFPAPPLEKAAQGSVDEGSGIVVVRPVSDAQPEASQTNTAEAAAAPPPTAAPASPAPKTVADQPASEATWVVKPGDTLAEIAKAIRHESVLLPQMYLAIFRANPDAFQGQDARQLMTGKTLSIPKRESAAAIDQAEALAFYEAQLAERQSSPGKTDLASRPARANDPLQKGEQVKLADTSGGPDKTPAKPGLAPPAAAETSATQSARLSGSQPHAIERDIAELQQSLGIASNADPAKRSHADSMKATDFQSKIWLAGGIAVFIMVLSFFMKYRKKPDSTGETIA